MGNLSFLLGGKAASDGDKWTPNIEAVKASVKLQSLPEGWRERTVARPILRLDPRLVRRDGPYEPHN